MRINQVKKEKGRKMRKDITRKFLILLLLATLLLGCTGEMPSNNTQIQKTPQIVNSEQSVKAKPNKTIQMDQPTNFIDSDGNLTVEEQEMNELGNELDEVDSLLNELQELESIDFDI
jgi:vacuolar-type H+-ATPase subunit I/STV1